MWNRLVRVVAVLGFLYVGGIASPAAAQQPSGGCEEYMCRIPVAFGGGYYCIGEGQFDCICNMGGCFCGYCTCIDGGDCFLMPSQG